MRRFSSNANQPEIGETRRTQPRFLKASASVSCRLFIFLIHGWTLQSEPREWTTGATLTFIALSPENLFIFIEKINCFTIKSYIDDWVAFRGTLCIYILHSLLQHLCTFILNKQNTRYTFAFFVIVLGLPYDPLENNKSRRHTFEWISQVKKNTRSMRVSYV